MTLFRVFWLTAILAFTLSSCASLTKQECLTSDWQVIGERDGTKGVEPREQFNRHVQACKRAGVVPDHSLWHQGYQRGLVNYCTPVRGLRVGQEGSTYHNVCPAETELGFLSGYQLGSQEYQAQQRISSIESRISILQGEIDELLDSLRGASKDNARSIRTDIDRKRHEITELGYDKEQEIYQLSTIQQEVTRFQSIN